MELDDNYTVDAKNIAMQSLYNSIFSLGDLNLIIENQYKIMQILDPSIDIDVLKQKNNDLRSKITSELFTTFVSKYGS